MTVTIDSVRATPAQDLERAARLVLVGELVASVTHDLRQPLTAIEMNVAAALRLLELTSTDRIAANAHGGMAGAIAALNDALVEQHRMREALSVLQDLAAEREPSFEPLDLCRSVRDVVGLMATEASHRLIHVEVDCTGDLPLISADATLVRQALLNVLREALESATACEDSQRQVRVSVRATSEDAVDVVISHFGNRNETSSPVMGLALARSVAHAHDTSLDITADTECGVAVTTRWPVHGRSHDTLQRSVGERD